MKRKIFAVAASAGIVISSSLAVATPANAALTTRCVGEGGAVTVPGDLVVPKDKVCTLDGTTIQGNVRVAAGADLVMTNVTVEGNVVAQDNAYVEAVGSEVAGRVNLNGAFGAYVEDTEVAGNFATRPSNTNDTGGFVLTAGSTIGGNLVSDAGEVLLETSEVAGNLNSTGSYYTDLYESYVDGRLNVTDNELGGVACAVSIAGNATYTGNADAVQLGSDGPNTSCDGASFWGGNVTVSGNTGGVFIDQNIVNGKLILEGNDPVAQVGEDNRVRRGIEGDFEEWGGNASAAQMRTMAQAEKPATRKEALEAKIADRGADAEADAAKIGAADL